MSLRSRSIVLATIVCLTLVWAPCQGATPFTVVTSNYPPFSFIDGDVQKGIGVDVLKEAFARMKVELKIEFLPFPRAIQAFESGSADGIFPFAIKDERIAYTLYPKEYLVADTSALFVRADSPITFDGNLGQLGDYTFGLQRDAFNGSAFSEAVNAGVIRKIEKTLDQRQVVLMLVQSRFDIAIGPSLVVRYYARETGNAKNIKELRPALEKPLPAYLGFSKQKDLAALMLRFDQTIAKMRRDGTYQRIMTQYLD